MKNWDDLSIQEKSDLIRVAIDNGITGLSDIKAKYNEFAGGGKKKPISPSAKRVMQYFISKGLTDYQAAGLVGNLMRESEFNPETVNPYSGAYGIAQWLGPRKAALFKMYGKNPTLDQQLDFVWHELNTTHTNGLKHLRNSRTALEAARNAMGYYEFSAGPEGAIADMIKHNQDGRGAMAKGIQFAGDLIGETWDYHIMPQRDGYNMPMTVDYNNQTAYQPNIIYANPALNGYRQPQPVVMEEEVKQPIVEAANGSALEELEKKDSLKNFSRLMGMLNGSRRPNTEGVSTTSSKYMNLLLNSFDEGGPIKKLRDKYRITGNLFQEYLKNEDVRYLYRNQPSVKIKEGPLEGALIPVRKRHNNSPTKEKSEEWERGMMRSLIMDDIKEGISNDEYDIPFDPEKAIIINGSTTSTNALDSLAKYAGIHNRNPRLSQYPIKPRSAYTSPRPISLNEMLGLAGQETHFGAQIKGNNNGNKQHDRELANSNFFTAYGFVPAEYLVRNFNYNHSNISRDTSPLLDAFQYYAQGDYNRNDSTHFSKVNSVGESIWKNPAVKEWWDKSGKYWYYTGKGPKK